MIEATETPPARCDVILRGGHVIDGTGAPRFRADVAVSGDRIVAVGALDATDGTMEIDAAGMIVAPGFIDVHTHDDRALVSMADMPMKVSQGVTTVVAGNCGISLAPTEFRDWPPPPMDLLGDQAFYRFGSFGAFRDYLTDHPPAVNAGLLVGHIALRYGAMQGGLERAATDREIAAMETAAGEAMDDGAVGLSTGLDYREAVQAPQDEVTALARAVAGKGGLYASHTRNYFEAVIEAVQEAIDIGRDAALPVVLSHHQVSGKDNFGRSVESLKVVDEAIRRGQDVALDVYPYAASSKTLDPQRCQPGVKVLITWSESHPEMVGKEIAEIATIWETDPISAAERLLPAGAVYFQLSEEDVQRILAHSHAMIGSDGLPWDDHPHPRLWGTFPRVLGHYARELNLFSLEEAVRRMTGLPAKVFGFSDRGEIRPGAFADICVFDPATVLDRGTFMEPRTPAAGILHVLVNGEPTFRDGAQIGARPGRVLRREA
jgi:N-acyl-D-amino-acid deacylase